MFAPLKNLFRSEPTYKPPVMGQTVDCKGNVLKPADAVRFDCGGYQHWGVYAGEGQVIHMTAKGVEKKNIVDIANECPFFKDNSFDKNQRPFMTQGILNMAETRLGEKNYNFLTNNCEIFVNQVRCGNSKSRQVDDYLKRHHVGNFDIFDDAPDGQITRTTFIKTNGGHVAHSHTFSDQLPTGGGQGQGHATQQDGSGSVSTTLQGTGTAHATSGNSGVTLMSISTTGGAFTTVPIQPDISSIGPGGSTIKNDLSCPVCRGEKAPSKM